MKIVATRKEDDTHYQGPFWIKAEKFSDILREQFELICIKELSDYEGNHLDGSNRRKHKSHKAVWDAQFADSGVSYQYYPRGRVSIYKGVAYLHLNSRCNTPKVVDAVITEYGISKLELFLDLNDETQGSHYDFELV